MYFLWKKEDDATGWYDSKKTMEIEIDRQFVTTDSPEFEKISTELRIDIPESSLRC